MPELPEVETVRAGLAAALPGRRVDAVRVLHERPVRRQAGGAAEFVHLLNGRSLGVPRRRGKYLWLPLDGDDALLAHLGMSGQFRIDPPGAPLQRHARVVLDLTGDDGAAPVELRFVDQRMFGGLAVTPTADDGVPGEIAHIARDLLDPDLDRAHLLDRIGRSSSAIKRLLLNQSVVSGIGNIYADEALWRARVHPLTPGDALRTKDVGGVLDAATAVMSEAIAQGGTSFDALYVNVNGESGYFDRTLAVYGREDEPCPRCGSPVVRESFMNRSSHLCRSCQRLPPPPA